MRQPRSPHDGLLGGLSANDSRAAAALAVPFLISIALVGYTGGSRRDVPGGGRVEVMNASPDHP